MADPRCTPEAIAIPMALDGIEHPVGFLGGGGVVVAPKEPQTAVPVLVHKLAERGVGPGRRQVHMLLYCAAECPSAWLTGVSRGAMASSAPSTLPCSGPSSQSVDRLGASRQPRSLRGSPTPVRLWVRRIHASR